ncbi:hypothetical protein F8388_016104 [Cannabis sativa]|uniref:Uncharacterized protein n=1 Tax=Cannabis sativa TaxID=3483 RepID=A0A7J6FIB3_CANSA|nr:hypothetical protein F8388_016104 [Cannabis sativa]
MEPHHYLESLLLITRPTPNRIRVYRLTEHIHGHHGNPDPALDPAKDPAEEPASDPPRPPELDEEEEELELEEELEPPDPEPEPAPAPLPPPPSPIPIPAPIPIPKFPNPPRSNPNSFLATIRLSEDMNKQLDATKAMNHKHLKEAII